MQVRNTAEFLEDEDNVLMESKRVPSARSAAIQKIDQISNTAGVSNLHTQQRQLTKMLDEVKQENSTLKAQIDEMKTELENGKEALSYETLGKQ